MSKLLDFDSFTGIKESYYKDPMTGRVTISKSQDVEKVLNHNKRKQDVNTSWKGDFHHVASIPVIVVEQWRNELKAKGVSNCDPLAKENQKFLIAKINSNEFSYLRTKSGRV